MPFPFALLAAALASQPVADFELRDTTGAAVRLSALAKDRPAVVVFLGADCPLASLYAARLNELAGRFPAGAVAVLGINPNRGDDLPAMAAFAGQHKLTFPFLKDPDGRIAARFGATRSPQAFVLDAGRRIRYRGRIDDQYEAGGKNRGAPTREDLVEAVKDVLAGRPVSVPVTECTGCFLSKPRKSTAPSSVTYARHRTDSGGELPGVPPARRSGPFTLLSYADARSHAETIAEVVGNGTMPPWHASLAHGSFRNQRRLSDEQKQLIAEWVRSGCPEGDPLPPVEPPATGAWKFGTPDAVFRIPQEFKIPAEGMIEYQHFVIDPGFKEDVWANAFEIRPGNRRVVHHCSVFLLPPNAGTDETVESGPLGSYGLVGFAPGTEPARLPPGMAKRIPAGWRLHFIIHYTPIGTPQTDRTELGLWLLDPRDVRKEVATKFVALELSIPPHAPDHRVEHTWTAKQDVLLISLMPHMHLRGKSARYTAEYPDGTTEILLDVPRYDFNWQHIYELSEPKRLPAGTVIRGTAIYDNSAANPHNPDPTRTVKEGEQIWDEMFNFYFDIALADQDMPAERAAAEAEQTRSRWTVAGATALTGLWGVHLWRKRRSGTVSARK